MPSKVWDEITYPFPNFNGCWSLRMDKWFYPTLYNGCNCLSMFYKRDPKSLAPASSHSCPLYSSRLAVPHRVCDSTISSMLQDLWPQNVLHWFFRSFMQWLGRLQWQGRLIEIACNLYHFYGCNQAENVQPFQTSASQGDGALNSSDSSW